MDTDKYHDAHFYSLDALGLTAFHGPDAQSFLHGQVTCDINGLAPDASRYGGYCSPKGRLLATFLVWRTEDGFVLQLPQALREPVQKRLSMFILRAKVKAADATGAFAAFGVVGKGAPEVVAKVLGAAPPAVHGVRRTDDTTLLTLPGERIELIVPAGKATEIREALQAEAPEADAAAWELATIRAGIPMILPATQEAFVPQMVNLDLIGGVSYTKGCYPGQEIVARTHYLGRLKQRTYLAHIAGDAAPQPGDPLYSADFGDQAAGTIVNAAPTPGGGFDVLAVIQVVSANADDVHWGGRDGPRLVLNSLPYAPIAT